MPDPSRGRPSLEYRFGQLEQEVNHLSQDVDDRLSSLEEVTEQLKSVAAEIKAIMPMLRNIVRHDETMERVVKLLNGNGTPAITTRMHTVEESLKRVSKTLEQREAKEWKLITGVVALLITTLVDIVLSYFHIGK